jgi:hypothetical protein
VSGNFDTVAKQQQMIRELDERLVDAKATARELATSNKEWQRAFEGMKAELLEENTKLVAAQAELLEAKLNLEIRVARLTEAGVPAPTSVEAALEQLFDAEAVFAVAERTARTSRCTKFDAQMARDLFEQQAIESLMQSLAIKKTEAKERRLEHPRYLELEEAFRAAARDSDEQETQLCIAASRVETLRACVHALARHSPLTARAVAITRSHQ